MNANEITAVVLAAPRGDESWGADGWETPICGLGALERVGRALAEFGAAAPWVLTARSEIAGSWRGMLRPGADLAARLDEISLGRPILVVRGDLPLLTARSLRDLMAAFSEEKGRRLVDLSGAVGIFRSAADAAVALNSDTFSLGGGAWQPGDADDVRRFGSPADYGAVSRIARERILARLAAAGVLFVDPAMTYVDEDVRIARDTTVFPGSFLRGRTTIGSGCTIGPDAWIESSDIEDRATIRYSVVESARVREAASVGPYAHLRHESDVGPEARVGNFVEIKASRLGRCVKAGHLSYLGDADVEDGANIGAGTITCNYDGKAKHRTTIGGGAFVGSNSSLVAPVTIGRGAVIGAGSTITEDVPPDKLAIARARQVIKEKRHEPSGEDT